MPREQLDAVTRHIRHLVGTLGNQNASDAHLLERFVSQRDEAAFAALVERHGGLVWSVCHRILDRREDVEDAFQATFLVLIRRASSVRKREAVASWLYAIAYRIAMKAKKSAAKRLQQPGGLEMRMPEQPPSAAALRELQALLEQEIQRLPEKYRAPFLLCCLEGKSRDEAAQELAWKPGTVAGRLARARKLLQQRLECRGVTLAAALCAGALGEQPVQAAAPATLVVGLMRAAAGDAVGTISTQAIELAKSVVRDMWVGKMVVGTTLFLTLGLLVGSVEARHVLAPSSQPPDGAEAPMDIPDAPTHLDKVRARVDRFGDPLPEGALTRLGTVRLRHGNGASLAFAPGGKSILTCGADRTIRTWDLASGRLLDEQKLPNGLYAPVAVLSPDGGLLAFQDGDLMDGFYLWDVARKQLRHKLPLGEIWYHSALFSPDSKTLVTAQQSGVLKAWDVATGQGRLLGKHKRECLGLSFSVDGALMTLSWDPRLYFWDPKTGRKRSDTAIPEDIADAILSPDSRTVAAWTWHNEDKDRGLQFLDAATGKPARGWIAPKLKRINHVRFTLDGKTVLIGTAAGVAIWDPLAGRIVRTLPGYGIREFVLSPDGKTVAALGSGKPHGGTGTVLHVWDLATGIPHAANEIEKGHLGEVDALAFAPDGRTIASSCGTDHTVRLWDVSTGRLLRSVPVAEELSAHNLAFSLDGKRLFVGTSPAILCLDPATGREVRRYRLFEPGGDESYHLMHMRLLHDGQMLLAVSQNLSPKATVGRKSGSDPFFAYASQAWNVTTGKRLRSDPLYTGGYASTYFSDDGRLLAITGESIRDAATGKELVRPSVADKWWGDPVAFSPDGALFAAGVWQKINRPPVMGSEMVAVQVWELATLLPVARLETAELAPVLFTPDSRHLVTAGLDGLKLWDLVSGREMARRPAPGRFRGSFGPSFVSSWALAADGHTLATGQPDTTILLWDLSPSTPARQVTPLTAARLDELWQDLGSGDGRRALAAVAELSDAPKQAVPLLQGRLQAGKAPSPEEVHRLIADLDVSGFAAREAAIKRLAELGELAESGLQEALRGQPSAEARRRIEELLKSPRTVRGPVARRHLRALRVLESAATPEAHQALARLAQGAPEARLTQEAKASLQRLARRR